MKRFPGFIKVAFMKLPLQNWIDVDDIVHVLSADHSSKD